MSAAIRAIFAGAALAIAARYLVGIAVLTAACFAPAQRHVFEFMNHAMMTPFSVALGLGIALLLYPVPDKRL